MFYLDVLKDGQLFTHDATDIRQALALLADLIEMLTLGKSLALLATGKHTPCENYYFHAIKRQMQTKERFNCLTVVIKNSKIEYFLLNGRYYHLKAFTELIADLVCQLVTESKQQ